MEAESEQPARPGKNARQTAGGDFGARPPYRPGGFGGLLSLCAARVGPCAADGWDNLLKEGICMKRLTALLLALVLVFSLAACGNAGGDDTNSGPASSGEEGAGASQAADEGTETAGTAGDAAPDSEGHGGVLVAYFSWSDNAVLAEDVDAVASPSVIAPGNVQQLAGWVQEETGADLFSIRVTDPYPSDWDACLSRANRECGDNARPELVGNVEDLSQYDTIFLGYPNWWYGVPMALLTFLESNDFSGKQVYLFCSHGTGGLASSVDIITEAIPNAEISDNIFDCYEEDAPSSQQGIRDWVAGLGY